MKIDFYLILTIKRHYWMLRSLWILQKRSLATNQFKLQTSKNKTPSTVIQGLPWWLRSKQFPCNAVDAWNGGSIPELGRPPGGGNGNLLHYSYLRNPMNRRASWVYTIGSQIDSAEATEQACMYRDSGLSVIFKLVYKTLRSPIRKTENSFLCHHILVMYSSTQWENKAVRLREIMHIKLGNCSTFIEVQMGRQKSY